MRMSNSAHFLAVGDKDYIKHGMTWHNDNFWIHGAQISKVWIPGLRLVFREYIWKRFLEYLSAATPSNRDRPVASGR